MYAYNAVTAFWSKFEVFTRATLASEVLAIERWLAGWLAVTRWYCV